MTRSIQHRRIFTWCSGNDSTKYGKEIFWKMTSKTSTRYYVVGSGITDSNFLSIKNAELIQECGMPKVHLAEIVLLLFTIWTVNFIIKKNFHNTNL